MSDHSFEPEDGFPPGDLQPVGVAPTEQEAAEDAHWVGSR